MCAKAKNRNTFTKTPYFEGLRSLKVIDAGTPEKLVSSVSTASMCLSATVFTLNESIAVENHF